MTKHKRFSELYGIHADQSQLDFVDITPARDTPLFIDPFAISIKNDEWSRKCHRHITHFFETAIEYIRTGKEDKAKSLLNGLGEPNETCLGLSRGKPKGKGVSGKQAIDLYDSLSSSQAAKTGVLSQLAECDLFIKNIGADKVSDITTNIIRRLLVEYTIEQCKLHDVELKGQYQTGHFWDMENMVWRSEYAPMPVVNGERIILVPKYSVRRGLTLDAQEFYSHHVLNFIQQDEFTKGSSLVRTLVNGEKRPPTKKKLEDIHPFSKDFLARFSKENPEILKSYKEFYSKIEGARGALENSDFDHDLNEELFAKALGERLSKIPAGNEHATAYHTLIVGVMEFIFWPNLIYPRKEAPIHDGRKRIDITYTNAALNGFFYRAHSAFEIASNEIMVECKNYSADPKNPEIDQLSGRFSVNRGRLGFLLYRNVSDYDLLIRRCKDTATDRRGFIIPLGDIQIMEFLELIEKGARAAIDQRLENLLRRLF